MFLIKKQEPLSNNSKFFQLKYQVHNQDQILCPSRLQHEVKLFPSARMKPEERADNRTSWTFLHHWRRALPSNFVSEKTARLYSVDRFFTSLTRGQLYLTILHTIYKLLLAYMKLLLVYGDWLLATLRSLSLPSYSSDTIKWRYAFSRLISEKYALHDWRMISSS